MLRDLKELDDYTISASDGNIGAVKDFLFDDLSWAVRYFVVETGSWLSSHKVLISPIAIQKADWKNKILPVLITKDQVKNSPNLDADKPVSRQHEMDYLNFYGYPYYWEGNQLWGGDMYPYLLNPDYNNALSELRDPKNNHFFDESKRENLQKSDPDLRSAKEIVGYHIHAIDGDIGHVSGLLVEEDTWAVRYLVIDTSNWWGGHQVLISPEWIKKVQWFDRSVLVDVNRQLIKDAPEYSSVETLNREHEMAIYEHYGLTGYWARKPKSNVEKSN